MKNLFEQIEHVKGKPHHVRKRVVFGVATGISALIALIWLVGSLYAGTFAIKGSTFADSTGGTSTVTGSAPSDTQNLAGAAAAVSASSQPAHIEIIDATSVTAKKKPEQTVIPF